MRRLPPLFAYFGADGRNVNNALALVRPRDGEPVTVLATNAAMGLTDLTWAPASELLGGTRWISTYAGARDGLAVVMDVGGRVVLERTGQFAGWSTSGEWVYIARREGLFAVRLDGSTEARVGPLGVAPVVATPP